MDALDILARWGHYLFGITWIGLLYYFNFVQTEYFKEADAGARTDAFSKLVPRALWYFRWGAAFTFLTGLALLHVKGPATGIQIVVGAVLGILMFLNVWLVIWPNQKIVVASNQQVLAGGEVDPAAAGAAPKAALASRTNTLFSIPMLYFMAASTHSPIAALMADSTSKTGLVAALVIVLVLELNALFGKQGPMTTVKGVIACGFALTAVLWGVLRYL